MNIVYFMSPANLNDKSRIPHKRIKILEAAMVTFSEKGFYNSTVSDVAKLAEVADGTIYLYFKNKDDLLISLFEYSIDKFIQTALKELTVLENPIQKLNKFVSLHLNLVQQNQHLAQVIQIELRQSSKFMKEYANEKFFQYLNIIEDILVAGQKQGIFKSNMDVKILKRAIFGSVDELALEWVLMKKKRYTMDEAATQLSSMILNGLQ